MIVADSNLIVSCVLESEATEAALRLRRRDGDWAVPRLWRYEVMNIFATLTRTGRLAPGMAERLYGPLEDALRAGERDPSPASVFAASPPTTPSSWRWPATWAARFTPRTRNCSANSRASPARFTRAPDPDGGGAIRWPARGWRVFQ